jgi:hypothetical protein
VSGEDEDTFTSAHTVTAVVTQAPGQFVSNTKADTTFKIQGTLSPTSDAILTSPTLHRGVTSVTECVCLLRRKVCLEILQRIFP